MNAKAEFSIKQAFVVEPNQLEKLYKLFKDRINTPSISSRCTDDIEREFPRVKHLLDYENPRDKRISSLTIWARTDDWKKEARISFSNRSWETISVSIQGTEPSVSRLKDEISEVIDGMKPWYWWVARIDFFYVILVVSLIGFSFLRVYAESLPSVKSEFSPARVFLAIGITVGIFGGLVLLVWGLNKLRRRYFPVAVFSIGQEVKRYETDEKIRWSIIFAFLVSLTASIIVTLF